MATNLSRLKVSLTKHGAHKIAYLISEFDKDEVLNHLEGDFRDINIDYAQTKRILSINEDNEAPNLWNEIKIFGEEDIFDLVFIAIILSHYKLIDTMIQAFSDGAVVKKGKVIDNKAYTNFAHTIDALGLSIDHEIDYVSFDISRIFYKFYLPEFVLKLLELKLLEAGWDKENTLIEESIKHSLNSVFNLSPEDFTAWLKPNQDKEIFAGKIVKPRRNFENGIKFSEGHKEKFDGILEIEVTPKMTKQLQHNFIQNELYKLLVKKHPQDKIGSEIKTNEGSIDLVRISNLKYIFYEIKTANQIKTSIRQAVSQLLEYAYWTKIDNIHKLIIVAPNEPTILAKRYLSILREKFNIPIYYQYFNLETKKLSDLM